MGDVTSETSSPAARPLTLTPKTRPTVTLGMQSLTRTVLVIDRALGAMERRSHSLKIYSSGNHSCMTQLAVSDTVLDTRVGPTFERPLACRCIPTRLPF